MHMDDLWFDVAIRGESSLDEDLIARLQLSDGAESGPVAARPQIPPSAQDLRPVAAVDFF